jgi:hypothetical protein
MEFPAFCLIVHGLCPPFFDYQRSPFFWKSESGSRPCNMNRTRMYSPRGLSVDLVFDLRFARFNDPTGATRLGIGKG